MVFDPHHENCFSTQNYNPREPTAAQFQSFWRAVRSLEKRGLLQSRKVPEGFMSRINEGRGGISFRKDVRLV